MNRVAKQQARAATRHVTIVGELAGDYVIDEGSGLEPLSAGEFEAFIAEHREEMLPPDDEG